MTNLITTTVRLPESQIDALDAMAETGEIPNRSEGIRAGLGYAINSDEWEVPDEAKTLAKFERTKRLSKVHFYREGFRPMVRRVLRTVGSTSPPWEPDQVERTAPKVFEDQIETLFDSEDRREWAWDVLEDEIAQYADAYRQEQPADENPYVSAFQEAVTQFEFDEVDLEGADEEIPIGDRIEEIGFNVVNVARNNAHLIERGHLDEAVERVSYEAGALERTAREAVEFVREVDLRDDTREAATDGGRSR